jgi:hypothetical protein
MTTIRGKKVWEYKKESFFDPQKIENEEEEEKL